MSKKTLGMSLLMGAVFLVCSCVDDTYDFVHKELSTDVEFKNNKLALPLGNLKAYVLDSLLKIETVDILGKDENGVYGINMSEDIEPIELAIDPIKLPIDLQSQTMPVEFTKAEITDVKIEGQSPETTGFNVPKISLDDLEIPNMFTNATGSAASDEVKNLIEQLKDIAGDNIPGGGITVEMNEEFSLIGEEVDFSLSYELPKEIEYISTILLKTAGEEATEKGALIGFEIIHPEILNGMKKTVAFDINFPEEFFLAKASTTEGTYTLTNNGHGLKVENLVVAANSGKSTVVQFYLEKLDGLDKKIQDGKLTLDEVIDYSVTYATEGQLTLTKDTKVEDFDFKVETNLALGFRDVAGKTNDIEVEFEPIDMAFDIDLNNLRYIDRIEYIDFDAEKSKLHFHAEMNGGFTPFNLKEGYALKLKFPKEVFINEAYSEYQREAVEFDAEEHAFYIYDLEVFNGDPNIETDAHWNLALDSFALHSPVKNGEFHHNVKAEVSVVKYQKQTKEEEPTPSLVLAGTELESLSNTLESLKSKEVAFTIWTSEFTIEDAVVHTEKITSPLDTQTEFGLNEKVPNEIGRIESIGFTEDVSIKIDMGITGLEDLKAKVDLDLNITLPSFLQLQSSDPNVKVNGNILDINKAYYPSSGKRLEIDLLCTGLNFMTEEFDYAGLMPKDSTDGNKYLAYEGGIAVLGEAIIEGMEFHSEVLEKMEDIELDVNFNIDEIQVKTFSGIYCGEIEEVKESIALDLGEDLAFLKGEGNRITLAEPQIEIVIENSISVPVNINLQLIGKDANGTIISSSEIITDEPLSINPATYDEATGSVIPCETKLLLTSDTTKVSKVGYQNVQLENLANLLHQIPDSIAFAIQPIVDQSVTHHVDLSQPLSFKASYKINIPFKFDEFQLCYSDTIENLQADLGETMEMFSNIALKLNMDITNTLPLGLTLEVVALDKDNQPIDDITAQPISLKAGLGGDIIAQGEQRQEAQKVTIAIESKSGDLSKLDKLKLDITAATDHTVGAIPLKGSQGIQLSNIVIEIAGDIKTSF